MTAIPATRRQFRELVDGTLEVRLHIDPPYRKAFLAAFPEIDAACCIVPLDIGPSPNSTSGDMEAGTPAVAVGAGPVRKGETGPGPVGPLCLLAVQWCKEPLFWEWIREKNEDGQDSNTLDEVGARWVILANCGGLKSRRELDTNPSAAALFHELFREPYSAYRLVHA